MYKFVAVQGKCADSYDIKKAEEITNKMLAEGYELVQAYQSSAGSCMGPKSILIMIFRKQRAA